MEERRHQDYLQLISKNGPWVGTDLLTRVFLRPGGIGDALFKLNGALGVEIRRIGKVHDLEG